MQRDTFIAGEKIPDNWAAYIENEANSLSKFEDFEIDNYADREVLNPNMQSYLSELIVPGAPPCCFSRII